MCFVWPLVIYSCKRKFKNKFFALFFRLFFCKINLIHHFDWINVNELTSEKILNFLLKIFNNFFFAQNFSFIKFKLFFHSHISSSISISIAFHVCSMKKNDINFSRKIIQSLTYLYSRVSKLFDSFFEAVIEIV